MIDPLNITKYDRTKEELWEFWIFCLFVAGKNARSAAKKAESFTTIFRYPLWDYCIREDVWDALHIVKSGQYNRLGNAVCESRKLVLSEATLEELLRVHGVGKKTARFFLLHSRPALSYAVLDTHILKYLKSKGVDAPKNTPTSDRVYSELENKFIDLVNAEFPNMNYADIDLMIWTKYANK